jgi:putative tryptophan/tyrosine transport system substrate-binding protein
MAMRRRDFIKGIVGSAATWPLAARAQQTPRMRQIGVLLLAKQDQTIISPFLRGLEALGYVDGKTIVIEYRTAEGNYERLAEAASELVALNPDVWRRCRASHQESDRYYSDRRGCKQ